MTIIQKTKVGFEAIKPLTGSTVHVSRREDLFDPEVVRECRRMLDERVVLVFPEAHLTDAEQLQITEMMGSRVNFTNTAANLNLDNENDVYQVTLDRKINKSPEYVLGTFFWHMDGMSVPIPLPKATLLSARKVAPQGGETEFANTAAAYNALSDADKAEFEGYNVIHSVSASLRLIADQIPEHLRQSKLMPGVQMERPLVYSPSGEAKRLLVGWTADYISGMEVSHGRAILVRLLEWAAQPDFTYTHAWREGDFVVWDNCAAMHRVRPYDWDSGRMMHRTSLQS